MTTIKNRYAFLDGIRGLAALLVLPGHTYGYWNFSLHRAYLAVDLFFILSGFVIASAYDDKITSGKLSVSRFMVVRLIRLYPVFLLSVALSCAIAVTSFMRHGAGAQTGSHIAAESLSALFFMPYYDGAAEPLMFPLNRVYWSLFFELLVNYAYVVVRPRLSDRGLVCTLAVSGAALSVCAFLNGDLNAGFRWTNLHLTCGLLRALFGIFLGLALFRYRQRLAWCARISPWWAVCTIGLILASASVARLEPLIDMLCVTIAFPLCISVASWDAPTRWHGVLLLLGSASYPIYVLHLPVATLLERVFKDVPRYAPVSGVLLVAVLIAASQWIERHYDMPVRRYLTALSKRRTTVSATA